MKKRELKALLHRSGFIHVRSRGDHEIWKHPAAARPLVLAGDDGTEVQEYIVKRVQKFVS